MAVHAVSVVLEYRLGHEGADFEMLTRHILKDIFVERDLVCGLGQGLYANTHFTLARRGHFVMMQLNRDAHLAHAKHRLVAELLEAVGGRAREIAFLIPRLIAQVGLLLTARVPNSFGGVDVVISGVLILIEANAVKNKELGFRPKEALGRDAGLYEILFRFLSHVARIAPI